MNYRLKKNGWHFKLQKWIFGESIDRMGNMCPYFWLTNFCIMVAPFVLIWRVFLGALSIIGTPFVYIIDKLEKRFEIKHKYDVVKYVDDITNWQAYRLFVSIYGWNPWSIKRMSNTHVYSLKYDDMSSRAKKRLIDRFNEWKSRNESNWKEIIFEERKLHEELMDAEREIKTKRKNALYKIADRTKLLVLLPLGIFLIYLVYGIGLIVLLIREYPMNFLCGTIMLLGAIAFIALLIWFANSCENNGHIPKVFKAVFFPIFRPIGSVLVFFGINIKLLYKNFCPNIDWED